MSAELHALQIQQLARIETLLTNMGCRFYILLPNGETRGAIPTKPRTRAQALFPYNEARTYYRPYVDDLLPGQAARIPFGKYPGNYLQGNLCAYLSTRWGKKSYVTVLNYDEQYLEVLRTEGI